MLLLIRLVTFITIIIPQIISCGLTQQIIKLPPKIAFASGAGWAYNAYRLNEMQTHLQHNPTAQENEALKFQQETYTRNTRWCKNICIASSSIAIFTRVGAYSVIVGTMWAISRSSKNLK